MQSLPQRACLFFKQNAIEPEITDIFNRNLLQMHSKNKSLCKFFPPEEYEILKTHRSSDVGIQFYVIISSMEKKKLRSPGLGSLH